MWLMTRLLERRERERSSGLQISGLKRLQHCSRPIPDSHFGKDARNVVFDSSLGDRQCAGDFTIIVSARNQPQNLDLSAGRRFGSLHARKIAPNAIEVAQQALRDRGMDQCPAARDMPRDPRRSE